jgi:hypothetical protein
MQHNVGSRTLACLGLFGESLPGSGNQGTISSLLPNQWALLPRSACQLSQLSPRTSGFTCCAATTTSLRSTFCSLCRNNILTPYNLHANTWLKDGPTRLAVLNGFGKNFLTIPPLPTNKHATHGLQLLLTNTSNNIPGTLGMNSSTPTTQRRLSPSN